MRALAESRRLIFTCSGCQKEFTSTLSVRKTAKNKYCSRNCYKLYRLREHSLRCCKTCNKEFRFKLRDSNPALKCLYCSRKCYMNNSETVAHLRSINAAQQEGKETKIERIGYALLTRCEIAFERQYRLLKFCVDAFVPMKKLVIQFDGDYWHGNTKMFSTLNALQRRNVQRDAAMDSYIRKCGYSILRIWGSELEKDSTGVTARLLEALN